MSRKPIIAIVGRPNVGKSTLFNRILGERKAVVHERPGMTRDRHYAEARYQNNYFTLIDTGGYEDSTDSTLLQQMRTQSIAAIDEADRVVFLTDVDQPNDPIDDEIIQRLRSSGRPFFLAVNKTEGNMKEAQAYADFSRFGLDEIFPISALHGVGVFELLDALIDGLDPWEEEEADENIIRVAIVGRQNVGKSTLVNRLLGQERVIANPLGGTTRDAIDTNIQVDDQLFTLIDTAGIRRRGKVERGPEKLSVHSSFRAIERADVALLMIDATEGITQQDQHIAGYVLEARKACIIVLNKWDLIEQKEEAYGELIREVRHEFIFMSWAPILTISAITGQRTHRIWDLIKRCAVSFNTEYQTAKLNRILKGALAHQSVPIRKGNAVKINYVTQVKTRPPTLALFCNRPDLIHFSYRRYLVNQFRRSLELEGTPLVLQFRRKSTQSAEERLAKRPRGKAVPFNEGEEEFMDGDLYANVYDNEGEVIQEYIIGGDDNVYWEDDGSFEDDEN